MYILLLITYVIGRICEQPRLDAHTRDNDGQRQEILVNKPEEIPEDNVK